MALSKVKAVAGLLLILGMLAGGTAGLARQVLTQPVVQAERPPGVLEPPHPPEAKTAGLDQHGDPLPDEAISRLGTTRLRQGGPIRFVGFTPDGKTLVTCGEDGARTWDVATGKLIHRFPKESASSDYWGGEVLFPDGKWVATPHHSTLHLWETATGKLIRTLVGDHFFDGVCFSPDGKMLASRGGNQMNEVTLWDPATSQQRRRWTTGKEPFTSFVFVGDGKTLVTASRDRTLRFWDVGTGKERRQHLLANALPQRMAVSPDGALLAVSTSNENAAGGGIEIWNVADGKKVRQISPVPEKEAGKPRGFGPLAFTPNGKSLLAGGKDGSLYACDLAGGKEPRRVWQGSATLWAVAASADGKTTAVSAGTSVYLIDWTSGKDLVAIAGHPQTVYKTAVTPDGRTVITASGSDLYLWEAASGRLRRRLQGHQGYVNGLRIIDGGRKVVSSAYQDGTLRVWDLGAQKEVRRLETTEKSNILEAVAPDRKTVAVGAFTATTVLIDSSTGKEVQRLQGPTGPIYGAAFTPDGCTLVVWYAAGNLVYLWDLATGRKVREYTFPDGDDPPGPNPLAWGRAVYTGAVSPDGRLIAFGSQGRFLELRDLASGALLGRLDHLPDGVCPMAFSPDCKTLAWAGWNEPTVHLVEVATGQERHRFVGQTGRVLALSFTADGTMLISGSADTTAIVWDLTGLLHGTQAPGKSLTAADLDACWAALAGDDAPGAYRTVQKLAAAPREAIPYLQSHLHAVPAVDEKRANQLIADLDSDDFRTREKATKELETMEEGVLGLYRKALEGQPSLETRRRLQALMEKQARPWRNPSPERVRTMRALEVLERVGTPEACRVLETLARGAPAARFTEEARKALERLKQPAR
jgi:WD40 repeat protein